MEKKLRNVFSFIVVFFLVLSACSKKDGVTSSESEEQEADNNKQYEDIVLLESESIKIMASDVSGELLAAQRSVHGQENPPSLEELLDKLLKKKTNIFYTFEDAKKSGYCDTDNVQLIRKFYESVQKQNKINDKIREEFYPKIKEEDISIYIPKRFCQITLRKILLRTEEEAKEVLKKAKAGEDFIKLVKEYSISPSVRIREGLTDNFFPGSDYFSFPEDELKAFDLEVGDLYDGVVRAPLGYMVYKIHEKEALSEKEINEKINGAKSMVFNNRKNKYLDQIKMLYVNRLKDFSKEKLLDTIIRDVENKEDLSNEAIAIFDGLPITYRQLSIISMLREMENEEPKQEITRKINTFKSTLNTILSSLLLADYYKDVQLSEQQKMALEAKIREVVARDYLEFKFRNIKVTEEEMRKFYEDNIDEMYTEKAKAKSQIIFRPTKEGALDIIKRHNNGEEFSKLAFDLSIDEPTRKNYGEMGWVRRDSKFVPENILNALFTLNEGEVSKPLEMENGDFAVVKVLEKVDDRVVEYEGVTEWTKARVKKRKINDAKSEYFKKIMGNDTLVRNEENIETVIREVKKYLAKKLNIPEH